MKVVYNKNWMNNFKWVNSVLFLISFLFLFEVNIFAFHDKLVNWVVFLIPIILNAVDFSLRRWYFLYKFKYLLDKKISGLVNIKSLKSNLEVANEEINSEVFFTFKYNMLFNKLKISINYYDKNNELKSWSYSVLKYTVVEFLDNQAIITFQSENKYKNSKPFSNDIFAQPSNVVMSIDFKKNIIIDINAKFSNYFFNEFTFGEIDIPVEQLNLNKNTIKSNETLELKNNE